MRLDMNCERLGNTMKNVIDIELLIKIPGVYKISSKPCQLYIPIEAYARVLINKWIK